mmetsp:Transcript_68775/g.138265  ORF Transcript_68775/g.138265 Transcript_68775/m.138265 type:complete len:215 (+) Transcript_68775:65-709(+)
MLVQGSRTLELKRRGVATLAAALVPVGGHVQAAEVGRDREARRCAARHGHGVEILVADGLGFVPVVPAVLLAVRVFLDPRGRAQQHGLHTAAARAGAVGMVRKEPHEIMVALNGPPVLCGGAGGGRHGPVGEGVVRLPKKHEEKRDERQPKEELILFHSIVETSISNGCVRTRVVVWDHVAIRKDEDHVCFISRVAASSSLSLSFQDGSFQNKE